MGIIIMYDKWKHGISSGRNSGISYMVKMTLMAILIPVASQIWQIKQHKSFKMLNNELNISKLSYYNRSQALSW